ncbi:MAG: hypothetical protein U1F36_00620 [Planctomycetota bacterium]
MRREFGLVLALCAGSLLAQDPLHRTDARTVPPSAITDDTPLFDQVADAILVSTPDWKARFDPDGTTFLPFLGSDAPHDSALRMHLRSVTVGDLALQLDDVRPSRDGAHLRFARGAVVEDYEVRREGLEQSFRIAALPQRGALRLVLATDSDLVGRPVDDELHFVGPRGGVRYGRAIAVDADGKRCEVQSGWSDGDITLTVPADFVATARLPLVVDPLVGTIHLLGTISRQTRSIDIAWSESLQRFAVCWERVWSANDSDVYVRLLDAAMNPVGVALTVDSSTTSWAKCQIASTETVAQQLVVAEVNNGGVAPYSVYGRMLVHTPAPALNPAFAIAGPAHAFGEPDATDPDVGGDPASGTTWFGVVWASRTGLLDSDILFNQVSSVGAVRFATHVAIDDTRPIAITPRISKSDGQAPYATQGWAIVYRIVSPATNTSSLRGANVSWNGIPRSFGGSTTFEIEAAEYFPAVLDVSSPTDDRNGDRRYAVVFERPGAQTTTIAGFIIDRSGNVLSPRTLMLGSPFGPETMRTPVVDCDGCRFTVAAVRNIAGNEDVVAGTTIDSGNGIFALVEDADLATSPTGESAPAVTARHSGGGPRMDFAAAWSRDIGSGSTVVEATGYAARQPGAIATRNTHCGTVTIDTSGTPALGVHFEVHAGGTGSVFGILAGMPTDGPIPGCNGCRLGVYGDAYTTTALSFDIPCSYHLMGGIVSFQAFALGGGTCLGNLGLSDTLDVIVR